MKKKQKSNHDFFAQESPLTEVVLGEVLNPDRIGFWKCLFLRRGENRSTRRKTSCSRVENQQQPQPTYDAESGIPLPRPSMLMTMSTKDF